MSATDQSSTEVTRASMSQVKRIIRLKKRRHESAMAMHLNIYPMMDIMTILLVFLIMQFASSPALVIQESPELKVPLSTSKLDTGNAMAIQISRNEISVDGERVVVLREGNIDQGQKQGGGNGFLVTPLYKRLKKVAEMKKFIAEKNKSRPFSGEVLVVADKQTPYRTLTEVLYTLGQAEFNQLKFVVNKKGEE